MALSSEAGPATACVIEMRREFAACLNFAQGQAPGTDSIDNHIRTFLAAASRLERLFESVEAPGGAAAIDAADMQGEVAALKRELGARELQLTAHQDRLLRWQQTCASVQLTGVMSDPSSMGGGFGDDRSRGEEGAQGMDTSR